MINGFDKTQRYPSFPHSPTVVQDFPDIRGREPAKVLFISHSLRGLNQVSQNNWSLFSEKSGEFPSFATCDRRRVSFPSSSRWRG